MVQQVKTRHVEESCTMETRLDVEHTTQLVKLRTDLTERLLSDLVANKKRLASDLQHEGTYTCLQYCDVIHKTGSIATPTEEDCVTATGNMRQKIGEVRTCGFFRYPCRQTERQTRQSETLHPYKGELTK